MPILKLIVEYSAYVELIHAIVNQSYHLSLSQINQFRVVEVSVMSKSLLSSNA